MKMMMMMMMMMMMYPGSSMTIWMYWIDPKEHILKVSCQYLYYWLRYRGYRGRGGKYFDDTGVEEGSTLMMMMKMMMMMLLLMLRVRMRDRVFFGNLNAS